MAMAERSRLLLIWLVNKNNNHEIFTVTDFLTGLGFLPFLGFGACTVTVATHSPDLIPTTLPPDTLQNFLEDFAMATVVFALLGIATPSPAAIDVAESFAPTETVGA